MDIAYSWRLPEINGNCRDDDTCGSARSARRHRRGHRVAAASRGAVSGVAAGALALRWAAGSRRRLVPWRGVRVGDYPMAHHLVGARYHAVRGIALARAPTRPPV